MLWLRDQGHRFVAADVLHFAPEPGVAAAVQPYCRTYTTADAVAGLADPRLDLEHLDLADATYDYVICSHVLEHVDDDEQALRELHRITRPGGAAILLVPLVEGWEKTFEDPDVTDPRRGVLFVWRVRSRADVRPRLPLTVCARPASCSTSTWPPSRK